MSHVALTFDDGPSQWTGAILDLLRDHGARATFFVIGEGAQGQTDVLARMLDEGHELGNHTWSHPVLTGCSDDEVRSQLTQTNELLSTVLGVPPRRYRAPHFDLDDRVDGIANRLGLIHTPSDVNPPDWHERWSAPLTITFVSKQMREGSVICLHDGVPPAEQGASRQATVDAVAALLPRLADQALVCVTASELVGSPGR